MATCTIDLDELALQGLAVRVVTAWIPHEGAALKALTPEARRDLFGERLHHVASAGILAEAERDELLRLAYEGPSQAAAASPVAWPPTVAGALRSAILQSWSGRTDSFLGDLFDAAVTLAGALVGDAIAGPPGAAAGAYFAHQWAATHGPDTW